MIVAIGGWVATNWKLLTLVGAVGGAGVTASFNHVVAAEERFDDLEIQAVRDSAQMQNIEDDVGEIKCMVVQNAQNEDPLDCLER
jgi:hypothetical protein